MNDDNLSLLEQQSFAQLNAAVQQHSAQTNQMISELQQQSSNLFGPPVSPQQHLANASRHQQWLVYFVQFDQVAEQLRAAGRPAFAQQLKAVKDDTEGAYKICCDMAKQAGAHQAELLSIAAEVNRVTTTTLGDINRANQAAFDKANQEWLKAFKGR